MRTQRSSLIRFVSLLFVSVAPVAVVSCSEPADPAGGAGSGGTSASGGTGGSTAGTGGSVAGTGGTTGGTAGSATGGTGGTGGSVAGAGSGGTSGSGGSAGVPVGGAGSGPMGGAAGSMAGTAGAGAGGSAGLSAGDGGMSGTAGAAGTAGAGGAGSSAGGASGAAGSAGSGAFTLTSPDHAEGAEFADPYTCTVAGFSGSIIPELHWTAGPPGTMSYAITFIDVTLAHAMPSQINGYHWVIWNIPANVLTLPEGFKDEASIGASQNSDFLGPCPNFGGGGGNTDTYEFTIYALADDSITIMGSGTQQVKNAEMLLEGDNLASTKLTGTSNASPP